MRKIAALLGGLLLAVLAFGDTRYIGPVGGGTASGSAGGALAGTYPNPTLAPQAPYSLSMNNTASPAPPVAVPSGLTAVVDVRQSPYNVKCDGTTDDGAGWGLAIQTVVASSAGTNGITAAQLRGCENAYRKIVTPINA